jgi:hypothetical protein
MLATLTRRRGATTGQIARWVRDPRILTAAAALLLLVGGVTVVATRPAGSPAGDQASHGSPAPFPAATGGPTGTSAGGTGSTATGSSGSGSTGTRGGSNAVTTPGPLSAAGAPGLAASGSATTAQGAGGVYVTSTSPLRGPLGGGTAVTIRGHGLRQTTGVVFGGEPAQQFSVRSGQIVVADAPAVDRAQTVVITLTLRSGQRIHLPDAFTYLPPPDVSGVSPAYGGSSGGTWVTVSGTDLRYATSVAFGDTPATRIAAVTATSLRALAPPHAAGSVDINVTTPGGTSATSPRDRYVYLP